MSNKDKIFYRGNQSIMIDFSAEEISTDGSLILFEKIEREHKLLKYFSKNIPDNRDKRLIEHSAYNQLYLYKSEDFRLANKIIKSIRFAFILKLLVNRY